jgi:hypothetical protein
MLEIVLGIFITVPSLLILIAYSIKGLFVDDYNPYEKLCDIDSFDALRVDNGKGLKRFLDAIKYEKLKQCLLVVTDGRNLMFSFGLYVLAIVSTINTIGISTLNTINTIIAIIPNIVAVIIIIITIQIITLRKKIGG